MRFDDALPIIEGKLYAWAEWRQQPDRPLAAISSAYRGEEGHADTPDTTSPQERWVVRQALVYESGVIEDAIRRCNEEQRELVFMRYVQRETWPEICDALHVSERTVFRIRDQALATIAFALGMWEAELQVD